MMKKVTIFAAIAMTMVGCSSDELVNNSTENTESPIAFSVEKKNISRGTQNLEDVNHYNFGVWAYKYKSGATTGALVMDNYLVGYSNDTDKGYDHSGATTWASSTTSKTDHVSPWFYEGLGKDDYSTSNAKFYQKSQTAYMSKNGKQILRYWDLAYATTNFYAYAPYDADVTFTESSKTMTFDAKKTIRDGYDNPLNSAYAGYDRSLSEYMYAGVQATNSAKEDVIVPFKHMGAQVNIRFYEDIPNYRVEIIDLTGDDAKLADGVTAGSDMTKGIQATPAEKKDDGTYESSKYFTTNGATVTFGSDATPDFKYTTKGSSETSDNLMFLVPNTNLETVGGHSVIPQDGDGKYSESPTVYYAVAQPTESKTGFTFHISYRIIAEDNNEVITVHNATVFVPAKDDSNNYIAAWQPNNKYTYTFKITKNSTGTTNPETPIDPIDPTTSTTKGLYPIVFDGATIEDYTKNTPESEISKGTNY
ncbi:MAG: fimbrillin family protein [Bacteroidaceae bacterium]|nr:fimbrillin family protein [Bacteroidaceae bacterium]